MKKTVVIILILFLQSCIITDFKPVSKDFQYKKILSDTTKSYVYRANMQLYNNEFSGMLVIKPQTKGHRIVFLNEMGMKFFDIELTAETYKVYQIFTPMNKKMLIKLLVSDFKFILMSEMNSKPEFYKNKKNNFYALKQTNKNEIYFCNRNTKFPENAFRYSLFRKNTFLNYENYKNEIPHKIRLKHKNIKFAMVLSLIRVYP